MEGETSQLKTYREGKMDAANEKVFMQKMLECVKAQAEVLKKIIGHLSEIDKEEAEKWKAKHESNELTQEGIYHVMAEGKDHRRTTIGPNGPQRDDGDWFLDKARRNFPNKGRDLYDMTEAMHAWEPLKKEDDLKRNGKP
nr:hypothetical protein CFP56_37974 [Quercus suber]